MGIWHDESHLFENLDIDRAGGPDRSTFWWGGDIHDIRPRGEPLQFREMVVTNNVVIQQLEPVNMERLNEMIAAINEVYERIAETMLIPAELFGPVEPPQPEPDGWVEY